MSLWGVCVCVHEHYENMYDNKILLQNVLLILLMKAIKIFAALKITLSLYMFHVH